MTVAVDSLIHEYARRYVARDVDGVTELCLCPFLAIREGVAIHLADSAAVHDHFMTIIDAYRDAGYASFSPGRRTTCSCSSTAPRIRTCRRRSTSRSATRPAAAATPPTTT